MSQVAERTRAISVIKLHPDIGAEIRGVDLSRPLDEETLRADQGRLAPACGAAVPRSKP